MSPVVDETAGDLPVKDVGLMRGGLMPAVPGSCVFSYLCVNLLLQFCFRHLLDRFMT